MLGRATPAQFTLLKIFLWLLPILVFACSWLLFPSLTKTICVAVAKRYMWSLLEVALKILHVVLLPAGVISMLASGRGPPLQRQVKFWLGLPCVLSFFVVEICFFPSFAWVSIRLLMHLLPIRLFLLAAIGLQVLTLFRKRRAAHPLSWSTVFRILATCAAEYGVR